MPRPLALTLALALAPLAARADGEAPARAFTFQREDVLGTSFRLIVLCATEEEAARAERKALDTIESLRQVLSRWDPQSELSRLNARPLGERKELELSPVLGGLLKQALRWHWKTQGAFDVYLGELHDLWREAARSGKEPAPEELARLVEATRAGPGYAVARRLVGARSVELLTCQRAGRFDVDGIAKGAIIDQALQAVRHELPGLSGALLAIGGDLRVWGSGVTDLRAPWTIDVVDPRDPADNAQPLCRIALRDRAVASSGGYARPLVVNGRRRAHIVDPRTGQPIEHVLGATAVADDAASADALATTLCVLTPSEGLKVAAAAGAECLIVDREGKQHASPGWERLVTSGPAQPWPEGFRVDLELTLVNSTPDARGFKRHYLAAWVEDAAGKRVRLLALWANGRELKYVRDLEAFWKEGWLGGGGADDPEALGATTRATRRPGNYTLSWDGKDDDGRRLPRGRYRLRLEVNREHGPPNRKEGCTTAEVVLECGAEPATAGAPDQPELAGVSARYGPKAP